MFQECYDLKTAQPTSWYEDMFGEVKKKVAAMGVDFIY